MIRQTALALLGIREQAMPNLRLIRIVALGNGAAFQPDPSGVQAADTIHWNNETNENHWLETTSGGFVTNNIPAGEVSNPGFIANEGISYRCRLHAQEQGTIAIVPAVVVPAVVVPAVVVPAVLVSASAVPPVASSTLAVSASGDDISAARKRKSKKSAHQRKAAKKKGGDKKKNR